MTDRKAELERERKQLLATLKKKQADRRRHADNRAAVAALADQIQSGTTK